MKKGILVLAILVLLAIAVSGMVNSSQEEDVILTVHKAESPNQVSFREGQLVKDEGGYYFMGLVDNHSDIAVTSILIELQCVDAKDVIFNYTLVAAQELDEDSGAITPRGVGIGDTTSFREKINNFNSEIIDCDAKTSGWSKYENN